MPTKTMEDKTELVRLNREYRAVTGHDYFIRTEPSGRTGTKWVFGDVAVYSLHVALIVMREGLETAREANVR